MSFIGSSAGGGVGAGSSSPAIQNSLRFRSSGPAYLSRSFSAGNRKVWTFFCTVKRAGLGTQQELLHEGISTSDTTAFEFQFDASDHLKVIGYSTNFLVSTAVFRDTSAFYDIVLRFDSTQATASNRLRVEVNGTEITSWSTDNRSSITQNVDYGVNQSGTHYIGVYNNLSSAPLSATMARFGIVDGQSLAASNFGATDSNYGGEWKPATNATIRTNVGTWGTNGCMVPFNDTTSTTTIGYDRQVSDSDSSKNNWTCNNISLTSGVTYDALIDSPNNGSSDTRPVGNYATLNPLDTSTGTAPSNANLSIRGSAAAVHSAARSTIPIPSTGKWVAELTAIGTMGATGNIYFGLWATNTAFSNNSNVNTGFNKLAISDTGADVSSGISASVTIDAGFTINGNDVVMFEMDCNTPEFYIRNKTTGKNVRFYSFTLPTTVMSFVVMCGFSFGTSNGVDMNFGQRPFANTPTTGFKALCTANLGTPAIDKPSAHFFAKTRTGTGASYSVTGIEFSPDLVWVKGRSGATDHAIYDAVRGATYQLESNTTTDETTEATGLTAFNSDGYSGGALAQINTNTATYIDWMWNESATAGVDIVTYTGNGANRTINHSLSAVPKFMIVKSRTTAGADTNWAVYHAANTAAPETDYLLLNSTAATADDNTYWNDTTPTSSVFSVGTHADVNTNSDTYVAYLFAEVAGFSKFGSYTGNGAADGVFVSLPFKPALVITKCSSTTGSWRMYDRKRPGYNVLGGTLLAESSGAETTTAEVDLLSNGFKARITTDPNSAQTFVYAAFAEVPVQYANAV